MWTVHKLDAFLHQVANQHPNGDFVLSGYVNNNAASKDYFESEAARLRNALPSSRRSALNECLAIARRLKKQLPSDLTAFAFFIRGGQRMFVYQVPLATPVGNHLSISQLPSLYTLCVIRDNLDRFSLIHVQPDASSLCHFELGSLHRELSFRARFGTDSWRSALVETKRQFANLPAYQPNSNWILAAPSEILADAPSLLPENVELLPVHSAAGIEEVRQLAVESFRKQEELQSLRLAHDLLAQQQVGDPVHSGASSVLTALSHLPVRALALHSRCPKDLALRWVRQQDDLFTFHDSVVWLACRNHTHIEIVDECEKLSSVGGAVCR